MVTIDGKEIDEELLREVITETANKDLNEANDDERLMVKATLYHYPDDREKRIDLMMCVAVSMIEAEEAGFGPNQVPQYILVRNAVKYGVEEAIIGEMRSILVKKFSDS